MAEAAKRVETWPMACEGECTGGCRRHPWPPPDPRAPKLTARCTCRVTLHTFLEARKVTPAYGAAYYHRVYVCQGCGRERINGVVNAN